MNSPKSLAKKLTVCGVATILALGLGELLVAKFADVPAVKVLELADPECVYQRSRNPVLGFELKPNYRHAQPDLIQSYERTNQHGFRDQDREFRKEPDVQRVIVLGDSVVEGYGLAQQDTITAQLERLQPKDREVLNFGVSAYCTRAEVELLETKGLAFSPDIVVLVFVENDFDNFNREAFPLSGTIKRPPWAEWLFARSDGFRLACLTWNWFQFRAESMPVEWNQEAIGDNNVTAGLARFRALATKHDFQPLVAIWPRFEEYRVDNVHFMPDEQQLVVEAIAAANGLPTVRLSETFEALEVPTPRLRFSQGDKLHPSAEGARVAALALHELLEQGIDTATIPTASESSKELEAKAAKLQDGQPNYSRVFNRIGNDHYKRGEFAEARAQYEKALAEDIRDAAAHHNLGIVLLQLDANEEAISHFREAIAIQPDFAEAHYNLGTALKSSDRKAAEEHLIQAIKLRPSFVQAHYGLSMLLLTQGRSMAGTMGLRQVLRIDPRHKGALNRLGEELIKQAKYEDARGHFETLVSIDPEHADAHNNLGAIYVKLGNLPSAISHFESALKADPDHPRAQQNLEHAKAMVPNVNVPR